MPPEKRTLVLTHFPRFLSDLEEEIYSAGQHRCILTLRSRSLYDMNCTQCCESAISHWFQCGSGLRIRIQRLGQCGSKIAIYLSLDLHKVKDVYATAEVFISRKRTSGSWIFFTFVGNFGHPGSGSSSPKLMRIRILNIDCTILYQYSDRINHLFQNWSALYFVFYRLGDKNIFFCRLSHLGPRVQREDAGPRDCCGTGCPGHRGRSR